MFIRKFSKSDSLELEQLIQQMFPRSEGRFLPGDRIWIAESGRKVVGFIRFSRQKNKLILNGLGTLPEFRGHGVATMLLEHALGELQSSPQPIYLKVKPLNPAVHLYERFGFTLKKFGETQVLVRKPKT